MIDSASSQGLSTAPSLLHQLPSPPPDFTGRESELQDLLQHADISNLAIFGLRGMGGIGKTALALVLAHKLTARYPDGQFYLDLRGTDAKPLPPADALTHILRAYTPASAKLPDEQAQLESLYRSALQGKRVLLLMDNARDAEQVSPLVPPPGSLLLITSRQQFVLRGIYGRDLEKLPPADAQNLLLTICPRIGEHAQTLAQLCGHLPLALRLAASSLAIRKGLSVDRYLGELSDTKSRLATLDRYRDQTDEKLGIQASLELSYCQLSDQLRQLWSTLSVFPATFDEPAAAAVWNMKTPSDAEETLGDLHQYSLIQLDEKTNRWTLHGLARAFAARHLSPEQRHAAARRHAALYAAVLALANDLFLKDNTHILTGLSLFDREWPNIEAGQRWAARHAGSDDAAARLASTYPNAGAYVLNLRLHSRVRIQWLESALTAARHLKERQTEAAHLGNLGLACAHLGETRNAIRYYEQALIIDRQIGDRRDEGADLGNLGNAYAALSEPHRAIEYHAKYLAIAREIGDRRGEGNALGNLGNAYADLGETHRAIKCYEQALIIDREACDRQGEGTDLSNLGLAYANLGEIHRAIEHYEQALVIDREIGNRRAEGDACWNMALALESLGQRDKAVPLAENALAIFRQIESPSAAKVEQTLAQWRNTPSPDIPQT